MPACPRPRRNGPTTPEPIRTERDGRVRFGVVLFAVASAIAVSPMAGAKLPVRTGAVAEVKPPKKTKKTSRTDSWSFHRSWWADPFASRLAPAELVLAVAREQVGKPYRYGSDGPSTFDCSGLTKFAWAAAGVNLPHNAAAQYDAIRHVDLKQLHPGDLVFSNGMGHVGIFVGDGKMIHAPHTGARVEVEPLRPGTIAAGRPGPG